MEPPRVLQDTGTGGTVVALNTFGTVPEHEGETKRHASFEDTSYLAVAGDVHMPRLSEGVLAVSIAPSVPSFPTV